MFKQEYIRRLLRFGTVGVLVMFFFMGLNGLLARVVSAQAAFFLAYPPALLVHFLLNKVWTFQDRRTTSGRHIAEYLYTVLVTFLIQWPVFTVCHAVFGFPGWLAAGAANLLQMCASFLLMQVRVFGPPTIGKDESARGAWRRLAVLVIGLSIAALLAWIAFGQQGIPWDVR